MGRDPASKDGQLLGHMADGVLVSIPLGSFLLKVADNLHTKSYSTEIPFLPPPSSASGCSFLEFLSHSFAVKDLPAVSVVYIGKDLAHKGGLHFHEGRLRV